MVSLYDKWYSSLEVNEKERIAGKIKGGQVNYPYCTSIWNSLDDSRKEKIYRHCMDDHGKLMKNWTEGDTFSF